MSAAFAEYAPRPPGSASRAPLPGLEIRDMDPSDVEAVAEIRAQRHGSGVREHRVWALSSLSRRLKQPGSLALLVATVEDVVCGYGCATRLAPSADAPPGAIPEGFYLGGVVVRPEHRRRGVGRALTRARLAWIFERAETAYYFQNAINDVSRDLHEEFGFREVRRGIWAAGVTFTGGGGVLYAAERVQG